MTKNIGIGGRMAPDSGRIAPVKRPAALLAALLCLAVMLAGCKSKQAPTPAAQGQWSGISSYVESRREAAEKEQAPYTAAGKDGTLKETSAAVTATKLTQMDKQCEVAELDGGGTLELWQYTFLLKLDVKDPNQVFLAGGQYFDEEGFFDLGDARRLLVALRCGDGTYDVLYDRPAGDGLDFYGYTYTPEEAVYNWYVQEKGLDLPLYTDDWPGLGQGSNFPVHRFDAEGFYLYLPTDTWYWAEAEGGSAKTQHWTWYSAYQSGSTFTVRHLESAVSDAAKTLEEQGFRADGEAYWRFDQGQRHERCRIVQDPAGGSYVLRARWSDSGLSVAAGASDEAEVMDRMMASFTPQALAQTPKAQAAGAAVQCPGAIYSEVTETVGGQERTARLEVRVTLRQGDSGTYLHTLEGVLCRNVSGWAQVDLTGGEIDTAAASFAKDRKSVVVPVRYKAKTQAQEQQLGTYTATLRLGVEDTARPDPDALTEEEIKGFNQRFDPAFGQEGVNPLTCFFTSEYADVREMSFAEFLRYFTAGQSQEPVTAEELEALKALESWSFGPDVTAETLPVPIHRIAATDIDAFLREYAGIGLGELKDTSGVDYLEENDCYYTYTSDAGFGTFVCQTGRRDGDLVTLWSAQDSQGRRQRLTLREGAEGAVQIVSFVTEQ